MTESTYIFHWDDETSAEALEEALDQFGHMLGFDIEFYEDGDE